MLAIHGLWSSTGGMSLWGENSDLAVKSPSQALRSARAHPFAATAADLAALHPGAPGTATLQLPSLPTAPLDSPQLVRVPPRPSGRRAPAILWWQVPVVTFGPAQALAVLGTRADGVRYGASVDFLDELAAFAKDLVERGRFLPAVAPGDDAAVAVWRPVLQGPDLLTAHDLVTALPPVMRAEAESAAGEAGPAPADVVDGALAALLDAVVREELAGAMLLPRRRGRVPRRIPVAEPWLAALTAPDGRFDADADEVDALARAIEPWSAVGAGDAGPARATFRLVDVDVDDLGAGGSADGARWRLEFLLQSVEDHSLLVPAEQVWRGADALSRWLDRPDELLLAELGRATSVYPQLAGALRRARPDALVLDTAGAHDFLSTHAAALDQAGFGVLVPSWWDRRRVLGLRARGRTASDAAVAGGAFSRETLVDFDWRLALGDDVLSAEELEVLAATKAPLVRLRGQWVAVDPEQLRRGLDFIREPAGPRTAAELIGLAAAHAEDVGTPLPVTSVVADGWLGDLLGGTLERTLEPVPPPAGLNASLRPYQERGLSWLAFLAELGLGACLADDMGLGKTIQLLALEAHRRATGPSGPTLLLCPMSLVGNWQREAARFTPELRVYAHHGRERLLGADLDARLADTDLMVTTYQTAVRDLEELRGRRWERLVLDEAQAIKNSRSRTAQAVRQLDAAHRVALTGTPVENRLSELWSVMDTLNPGLLGTAELFRARYAVPVERHGETEPAERLRRITRPYVLRRLKTDTTIIDDLPEKIEITQYYHLTPEQASLYRSVVDEMMVRIEDSEGIERRGNVLATMTKLKQVCNHPAQLLHDRSPIGRRSGKVIRLEEIVEEILAEGDRALMFTQFTEFADLLLPHLAARFGTTPAYLHGGTPKQRRDEMVRAFQAGEGPPLFVLSLKAGGTGLNLTAANHVIHLDRWWNPAVENQATDRAFRIGQQRNVQVRKFLCPGTLEERIDRVIEEKRALADLVVGDGEAWLTELSSGELRELFALSEEAVDE